MIRSLNGQEWMDEARIVWTSTDDLMEGADSWREKWRYVIHLAINSRDTFLSIKSRFKYPSANAARLAGAERAEGLTTKDI